jgi:excisionase family DNA binding protein
MIDAQLHEISLALQPPVETVRLLTVQEVAELLRVPVSWVYERTRRRGTERIPHVKMGKYVRFRPAEIEAYLEGLHRG